MKNKHEKENFKRYDQQQMAMQTIGAAGFKGEPNYRDRLPICPKL